MKTSASKIKFGILATAILLLVSVFAMSPLASAVTTRPEVTVTYKNVGKGGISYPYSAKVISGDSPQYVPTATPFKDCYFVGWEDEDGNIVDPSTAIITADTTFTTKFGEPYSVKYLSVGKGRISGPQTVKVQPGDTPSAVPTVGPFQDCFFTGWVDEDGNAIEPTEMVINEDRIFYATFGEPYTVTFYSRGEGRISGPQTIKVQPDGTPHAIPTTNPFTNYVFLQWVDEDGNKIKPTEIVINENRTFYAEFGQAPVIT